MRQSEDYMNIRDREKLSLARGKPLVAGIGLTLRAMAVTAGVVGDGFVATAGTPIFVAAERCRAAALDGGEHLAVQPCQPRTVIIDELLTGCAHDVGHLEGWPDHL